MKSRWLNNFNQEYISADFNHPGKKIHKTKKQKKSIYDANNARNRDAYSVTKVNNLLKGEKDLANGVNKVLSTNSKEVENTLIKIIDLKKKLSS